MRLELQITYAIDEGDCKHINAVQKQEVTKKGKEKEIWMKKKT